MGTGTQVHRARGNDGQHLGLDVRSCGRTTPLNPPTTYLMTAVRYAIPRFTVALLLLASGATSASAQRAAGVDTARATLLQAAVVTATRSDQTVLSVPASVAVLDMRAIEMSPAKSV